MTTFSSVSAPSHSPLISVRGVRKNYGSLHALNNVSFDVMEGEKVFLVGPSGSGKSTMLRCLNRLEVIQAGQILVEGEDIYDSACDICRLRQEWAWYSSRSISFRISMCWKI